MERELGRVKTWKREEEGKIEERENKEGKIKGLGR